MRRLIIHVLLLAFPRAFRDRIGRPLVQTLVTDSRTPDGKISVGRFLLGAADVVRAGLSERLSPSSARSRASSTGPSRSLVDVLVQDLRYGYRRLRYSPGFALVALLTLALGIGANTAVFQLLDAVRLRPLPVLRPSELAEIRIGPDPSNRRGNVTVWHAGATNGMWEEIRRRQDGFAGLFAWSGGGISLSMDGAAKPKWISALLVSGEYFPVLGVQPALGRLLTAADDTRGCSAPGVVLGHAFWQTAFGGDPNVIGRKVTMARYPFEIVGVAPPGFTGLDVGRRFDVAVPLCSEWLPPGSQSRLDSGVDWFLVVMGRRAPGVSLDEAGRRLGSISPAVFAASLKPEYPSANAKEYLAYRLTAIDASRGISMLREQYTDALWFLQATAMILLLVGCANMANLMLARAAVRERELAARIALGAGRGHLVRVLLSESLLLSLAGAGLGVLLAKALSASLVLFLDGGSGGLVLDLPIDWRVVTFVSLAATLTCVLAGLAPAWRAADVSGDGILRAGARGMSDSRSRSRSRQALVVVQVALSLALLAGAGLFARSLTNLLRQDLGFRAEGLTVAYVDTSAMKVPVDRRAAFKRQLIEQLERTPGVVSAAETNLVPLSGGTSDNEVWLDGGGPRVKSMFMETSSGYFRTMETPLVAGRAFDDEQDRPGLGLVAVVNETFAALLLPGGESPIGRRFRREERAGTPETVYEVVGVVKNAKYQHLRQEMVPTAYVALAQDSRPGTFMQMLIRTSPELLPTRASIESTLDATFRQAGPAIGPSFEDFREMIDRSLTQDQMLAGLSGFFAVLAVLLAVVGVYGSMSFAVARRTKEIGVRMALGADRHAVRLMVLRDAAAIVVLGCVIGGVLALALARVVAVLAFNVAASDPWTTVSAAGLLSVAALAASLGPARRASRLDPMTAVRAE